MAERESGPLVWRPFQLGFVLLTATSVSDAEDHARDMMDLLWFPTGGGKTEAYLFMIAFLAFCRRVVTEEEVNSGIGVTAVMRYTLRLLTTQQFTRAAAVMMACEVIRRERNRLPGKDLGSVPFSIGLWVGRDAVPNRFADAAAFR